MQLCFITMQKGITMRTLILFACCTPFLIAANWAVAQDANQIMRKVYEQPRVKDQSSTLTFTFTEPDKNDAKVVMSMLWRSEDEDSDYSAKMLLFPTYPPIQKGKNYMTWLRKPGSEKNSDDWLYLPELRKVMRLSVKDHAHHHDHNSDDEVFFRSVINRTHMDPRPPEHDQHKIIKEETIDNDDYYIIESKPINIDKKYPYKRTLTWVNKQNFLVHHTHYFDQNHQLNLVMEIKWVNKKNRWIWKQVNAKSMLNNTKTILEISDIKVNSGLHESTFSKRTLKRNSLPF